MTTLAVALLQIGAMELNALVARQAERGGIAVVATLHHGFALLLGAMALFTVAVGLVGGAP